MHGGYSAQPPRFKSQGKQAGPPSSGCTVHALGLKDWGGGFIWREFCVGGGFLREKPALNQGAMLFTEETNTFA